MKIVRKISKATRGKTSRRIPSSIPNTPKKEVDPNDPLSKARAEMKAKRDAGEASKRRNPLEVWQENKKSMRKAVNANCFDCVGQENYIKRIRYCDLFKCPFWLIRPYSKDVTKEQCKEWQEIYAPSLSDE